MRPSSSLVLPGSLVNRIWCSFDTHCSNLRPPSVPSKKCSGNECLPYFIFCTKLYIAKHFAKVRSSQFHMENTTNKSVKLAKDQILTMKSVQDLTNLFDMKSNLSGFP